MGDLIEVPARAPAGWNQDFDRYLQNDLLPRERGQLLAFYLDDDNDFPWGGRTGSPLSAHVCCGTTSYHKRTVGPMWTGDHPCCQDDANQDIREGEAIVHELFHLLGFVQDDVPDRGVRMSLGALDQPWLSGSLVYFAAWQDMEALRCIFPAGGNTEGVLQRESGPRITPPIMKKARECVGWGSGERSSHPGLGTSAELPLAGAASSALVSRSRACRREAGPVPV